MFGRVLVNVEAETAGPPLLAWVRRLLVPVRGEVRLLAVCPPARAVAVGGRTIAYADQREDAERARAAFVLAGLAARLRADGLGATHEVRFGAPGPAVLAAAGAWGAEVIAVSTPSVLDTLLESSPLPVLVVNESVVRAA
jgi:nucleotide-binding universal stress UspA family protein